MYLKKSHLLCAAFFLPLICHNLSAQQTSQKKSVFSLFQEERSIDGEILKLIDNNDIVLAAESRDRDYLAATNKDNSIDLYFKLHLTKKAVSKKLKAHEAAVYDLCFTESGNFLASADISGTVNIWDTNTSLLISSFSGLYGKQKVNLDFTYDESKLIAPTGRNSFGVFSFKGKKLVSIITRENIKKIKTIRNSSAVAVLTESDRIEIYNTETGRWLGNDLSEVKFILKNVERNKVVSTVADSQPQERTELPEPEKIISKSKTVPLPELSLEDFEEEEDYEDEEEELDYQNYMPLKKSRMNLLSFQAGSAVLNSPYLFSADINVEYRYSSRISPFFTGFGIDGRFGFPGNNFDNYYKLADKEVSPPYLLAGTAYMPFGVIFSPWQNKVFIITEVKAGFRVQALALLDERTYVMGKTYLSGFVSAGAGVLIDHFEVNLNCEFDTIGQISPSLYIGINCIFGER